MYHGSIKSDLYKVIYANDPPLSLFLSLFG